MSFFDSKTAAAVLAAASLSANILETSSLAAPQRTLSPDFSPAIASTVKIHADGSIDLRAGAANVSFAKPGDWAVLTNGTNWVLASSSEVQIRSGEQHILNHQLVVAGPALSRTLTVRGGSEGSARQELSFVASHNSTGFAAALDAAGDAVVVSPHGTTIHVSRGAPSRCQFDGRSVSFTLMTAPIEGEAGATQDVISYQLEGETSGAPGVAKLATHKRSVDERFVAVFKVEAAR